MFNGIRNENHRVYNYPVVFTSIIFNCLYFVVALRSVRYTNYNNGFR